jgi:DNA-3-methyladenine glycosylase I
MKRKIRCAWVGRDPLMQNYHDNEWGVPVHDDKTLFEFLILEGVQAGLSWRTVLYKRHNYRKAFHHFDFHKIAHYTRRDVKRLLANPGIIRNRLKIEATILNAQNLLEIKKEFNSFDAYIWKFVQHTPIQHAFTSLRELPSRTPKSDAMSKDLKKRGFKFVGSTICYAFMQAVCMVNDHTVDCFRYKQLRYRS